MIDDSGYEKYAYKGRDGDGDDNVAEENIEDNEEDYDYYYDDEEVLSRINTGEINEDNKEVLREEKEKNEGDEESEEVDEEKEDI